LGAARAAQQIGDAEQARTHYEQLLEVVGDAATTRDGVGEARGFIAG
jgi:Flp pilus assembly protein TadD